MSLGQADLFQEPNSTLETARYGNFRCSPVALRAPPGRNWESSWCNGCYKPFARYYNLGTRLRHLPQQGRTKPKGSL
jgi:hypothetical protein